MILKLTACLQSAVLLRSGYEACGTQRRGTAPGRGPIFAKFGRMLGTFDAEVIFSLSYFAKIGLHLGRALFKFETSLLLRGVHSVEVVSQTLSDIVHTQFICKR